MKIEQVNDRIRSWLGWQSIGYVLDDDRIVEHYARQNKWEVRGEIRKVQEIVPFDAIPDFCNNLDAILRVLLEAQLCYETGVIERANHWEERCFAIVRGEQGESLRTNADSICFSLALAFVDYLDKYGVVRE